jgi:protein-S-isoprenylcysteine O-methyltransferase Ste14
LSAVHGVAKEWRERFQRSVRSGPFDPPRRLVVEGPYRLVRNPMYAGAALVLCGAALFYQSIPTVRVLFFYEEPTLRKNSDERSA